jgi:hypothetical protein
MDLDVDMANRDKDTLGPPTSLGEANLGLG